MTPVTDRKERLVFMRGLLLHYCVIAFPMGQAELVIRENLCTHDWSSKPEAWPQRQIERATERAIKRTILPLISV